MFSKSLPRFVIAKMLASGAMAFYFNVPSLYRKLGCTISNEPIGTDYTVSVRRERRGWQSRRVECLVR